MPNTAAQNATTIFTDDSFGQALSSIFGGVFSTVNTHLNNKSAENIANISSQYTPPGSVSSAGGNASDAGVMAVLAGLLGKDSNTNNNGNNNNNAVLYLIVGLVGFTLVGLLVYLAVRGGKKA